MTILPKAIYRFNAILIKIPMAFLHRTKTNDSRICMETQKTLNCQSNLEKKEQSWRYYTPWFQTILWSYSKQNSMVLAQKLTHRSRELNRDPRSEPTHLWSINLWQWRQDCTIEKRQSNKWWWENWTAVCKRIKL